MTDVGGLSLAIFGVIGCCTALAFVIGYRAGRVDGARVERLRRLRDSKTQIANSK